MSNVIPRGSYPILFLVVQFLARRMENLIFHPSSAKSGGVSPLLIAIPAIVSLDLNDPIG